MVNRIRNLSEEGATSLPTPGSYKLRGTVPTLRRKGESENEDHITLTIYLPPLRTPLHRTQI